MKFKPLLASAVESLTTIRYPVLASPKLDGIRVIVQGGVPLTRNLKPIPNEYVREQLAHPRYEGLDGELVVGEPTSPSCFRDTSSGVMSQGGQPNFRFFVFDWVSEKVLDQPFKTRIMHLAYGGPVKHVELVDQFPCSDGLEVQRYEEKFLEQGYEGAMLRDPNGRYKMGRSTLREGILLKLKRHIDAEAIVEGFEERYRNDNPATINALGYTERSSHGANLVGRGDLGALLVRSPDFAVPFRIGSGFDDAERKLIWDNQEHYRGRMVRFKYLPIGIKDAPRFPIFEGWREDIT